MSLYVSNSQIAVELEIAESSVLELCSRIREGIVKKKRDISLSDDNQLVYSAMVGFVPSKKLTFFLESFGNKSSELQGTDNFIHLGII